MISVKKSTEDYRSQNIALSRSIQSLQNSLEEGAKYRATIEQTFKNEKAALEARLIDLQSRFRVHTEPLTAGAADRVSPLGSGVDRADVETDASQTTSILHETAATSGKKKKKKKKKAGPTLPTRNSPTAEEADEVISPTPAEATTIPASKDAYPRRLLEDFLAGISDPHELNRPEALKSASSQLEEGSPLWDESVARGLQRSRLREIKSTAENLATEYEVDQKVSDLDAKLGLFSGKLVCLTKRLEEADVIQKQLKDRVATAEADLETSRKRERQLLDNNEKLESTCEDVEQLRDMLRHVGSELVDAKDKIKQLEIREKDLQSTETELEASISRLTLELKAAEEVTQSIDELRAKVTDAESLAASRLEELNKTKNKFGALEVELVSVKAELGTISVDKNDLLSELADTQVKLRQIERSEKEGRDRTNTLQINLNSKEKEVTNLRSELNNIQNAKSQLEDTLRSTRLELSEIDAERREILQKEQNARDDVTRYKRDVNISREKIAALESIRASVTQERDALTEEVQLKHTQLASTQTSIQTLREQTTEMAHQAREAKERYEALEEELSEAHKLLSERARESDTMRRLLDEAEGREAGRMKEAKEKLEAAIEERDHLEEEIAVLRRNNAEGSGELLRALKEKEGQWSALTASHASATMELDALRRRNNVIEDELQKARQEADDTVAKLTKLSAALVHFNFEAF